MFIRFCHQKVLPQFYGMTSADLYEMKIIDKIIKEPRGGITKNREYAYKRLRIYLRDSLEELMKLSKGSLINKRYNKFREMGRINND